MGTPRRLAGALLAAVLLGGVAGCGSGAEQVGPSGVDGLVVPTPSPDPADFVADVDSPWLALRAGSTRTYAQERGAREATQRVTVGPGPRIAGVATTSVRTEGLGPDVVDHLAQDRAGNVWWLGREGVWQAGEAGAEAGLLVAATPRVGDGYRQAVAPGAFEATATVEAIDGTADVPAGRFTDLVVLEVVVEQGARTETLRMLLGRDVGLVATETLGGTGPATTSVLLDAGD